MSSRGAVEVLIFVLTVPLMILGAAAFFFWYSLTFGYDMADEWFNG